jgi:hypothetical protein
MDAALVLWGLLYRVSDDHTGRCMLEGYRLGLGRGASLDCQLSPALGS